MLSLEDIVKFKSPLAQPPPVKAKPYGPPYRDGDPFDVKKTYGHGARHTFDTQEEIARWGGVLSQAPQGYSGAESGTRSVVRSLKDDRYLATLDEKTKRQSAANRRFHDFLVNNVFPRFVPRFNLDGQNPDYAWEAVPQPCLDSREARWIADLAHYPYWRDDFLKSLIVTVLRFVVQHGDFTDPKLAWENRRLKASLVEAYHLITDKRDKHRDDWWHNMFEERRAKGEITA